MKRESQYKNFVVPNYLKRWINLKKVFNLGPADEAFNSPSYIKKCKPVSGGMTDMLKSCKLELEGKHHSGIVDARNLARCVLAMLKAGFVFGQGMVHVAGY